MAKLEHAGVARPSRREAIGRVAGALGIISVLREDVGLARAQRSAPPAPIKTFPQIPNWKTELRQLAPNVFAYIQAEGPDNLGVANAGCIVGPDHWMAIDSLAAPLHTKAFIAAATQATGKSVGRLVNTHHHSDHTLGNQFFLPVEIVGHEFCRQAVLETSGASKSRFWQKREGWADGTEEWKATPPVTTFNDKMTYHYGDMLVELVFVGPAHTWGDVMIYLPQHRILFAGDVAFHYVAPAGQSAHITKWMQTVDTINQMDVETIVPGHGPIGGKKELAEMRDYLELLKREVKKRYDAGMRPGQAAADINMGKFDTWWRSERIVTNTVRLYAEFNGTLVPATDQEATRRATEEYNALKKAAGAQ